MSANDKQKEVGGIWKTDTTPSSIITVISIIPATHERYKSKLQKLLRGSFIKVRIPMKIIRNQKQDHHQQPQITNNELGRQEWEGDGERGRESEFSVSWKLVS